MNPTAKKNELRFDSNLECGNLDLVVSVADNEFDLYLRVDSNTKGHACWFFLQGQQFPGQTKKANFNIVNFSRS
jgi:cytosolic carboxypeptidase protein 2/3